MGTDTGRKGSEMGRWISVVSALAIGLALGAPTVSAAQAPFEDSVTGTAATGSGRGFTEFTFDAHSGPLGERPTGTVTLDTFFGVIGPLDVSCLAVNANRASMLARAPENTSGITGLAISAEDNGPGQDRIGWHVVTDPLPSDCPVTSEPLEPTVSGDITVTDSPPPPTTYSQCRQAGWVKYGFAGRAACIDYVHERARQACIFERVAHGIVAFRAKYGIGPQHQLAMWSCVHGRTGF
jgi:hypothetical protein